jgi:hypothetical protein
MIHLEKPPKTEICTCQEEERKEQLTAQIFKKAIQRNR